MSSLRRQQRPCRLQVQVQPCAGCAFLRSLFTPWLTHRLSGPSSQVLLLSAQFFPNLQPTECLAATERGSLESAALLQCLGRIWGIRSRHEDGETSWRGSPGTLGEYWVKGLAPALISPACRFAPYEKPAGLSTAFFLCSLSRISIA